MADLVSTIGGSDSNSFISVDTADLYLESRLNSSAWSDAEDPEKETALIEATREISLFEFDGLRVTTTQALPFPRESLPVPDSGYATYHSTTEIPQRILDATCEYALEFLKAGTTDVSGLDPAIGIVQETVGPISTTYAEPYHRAQGVKRYPRIYKLISCYLLYKGGQAQIIRG